MFLEKAAMVPRAHYDSLPAVGNHTQLEPLNAQLHMQVRVTVLCCTVQGRTMMHCDRQ